MRIIAYVVAALLLFAGCAQDQPTEPAPTAKPSPTATVPSMPAAAKENTVAGAVAFVEHYIELLNYSSDTGNIEALAEASDATCAGCRAYTSLYETTYRNGGYFRDPGWTPSRIDPEIQVDKTLLVLASVTAPGGSFREASDSPVRKSRDEKYDLVFTPSLKNGHWVITRFSREAGQ